MTTRDRSVDVIVPSYNGRVHLARLISNLRKAGVDKSLVVVDDGSTDGSVEFVRSEFPDVKLIARSENGGFSAAVNDGIRATDADFVLVLNNDVEVTEGFLEPLLALFEDPNVFAVTPRILLGGWEGIDDGAKTAVWHHGMLYADHIQGVTELKPVFFASGCAVVYRRSKLEALGGFDEIFAPFYWEDVDLSYRAWKRGWKTLYQPASKVAHLHSATISKMPKRRVDEIKARNSLLFIWRNLEDNSILREHRFWMPLVLVKRVFCGDRAFVRGFLKAWRSRSQALRFRETDSHHRVLSDNEIFRITGVKL